MKNKKLKEEELFDDCLMLMESGLKNLGNNQNLG